MRKGATREAASVKGLCVGSCVLWSVSIIDCDVECTVFLLRYLATPLIISLPLGLGLTLVKPKAEHG